MCLFGRPRVQRVASCLAFIVAAWSVVSRASAQEADLEVSVTPSDAGAAEDAPPVDPAPAPAAPPVSDPRPSPTSALEERIRALELAAGDGGAPDAPVAVRVEREPSLATGLTGPLGLVFSGYVQGEYDHNQLSEDQLQQGGTALNQDRFLVRRARLRVDRAWTWASTAIEIDGNTTRGPAFGLRRAEVSLVWRNPDRDAPPYVRLTGGLSEIPFGAEMTESARARFFMERTAGSLALFPGEPDVGIRLSGGVGFLRYSVAALNGEPIDDRPAHATGDPNAAKDLVARVGIDTKARDDLRLAGGVSFLTGTGFHAGKDATKNGVVWRDLNENGSVDSGEIAAAPGTAATPSQNFSRWAFGADLQATLDTRLGKTRLFGEVFVAQNADRAFFVADPIATGNDIRELGFHIGLLHEVGRYAVVGFRTDHYNPNADLLDKRIGKLIPADASIHSYSPLLGVLLPDRVRLLVQYDAVVDTMGRDSSGVPTDLANDRFTIRLQGEL